LYADFAGYNKDGEITEEEAARLQKANENLAAQLIADRENLTNHWVGMQPTPPAQTHP
jgi:hypothetical protein